MLRTVFLCTVVLTSLLAIVMPARSVRSSSLPAQPVATAPTASVDPHPGLKTPAPRQDPDEEYEQLPVFTVTSANDRGAGTLREAFAKIQEDGVSRRIVFHLEPSDPNYDPQTGVWRVKAKIPFVLTKDMIFIDGLSQTEYGGDTNSSGPEVVIDGSDVKPQIVDVGETSVYVTSLFTVFGGSKNWIRGLDIVIPRNLDFFSGAISAIILTKSSPTAAPITKNRITDCYIGINPDGETIPVGNWNGIILEAGVQETLIDNNVIVSPGIDISITGQGEEELDSLKTVKTTIRNNKIGTNSSGTKRLTPFIRGPVNSALPPPTIYIKDRASETLIERNIISGTRSGGVGPINQFINATSLFNTIRENRIGIGPNGENIAPSRGEDRGAYAIGIFAIPGDFVSKNIIGFFPFVGIYVRNHKGLDATQQTRILENQIINIPVGMQIAQVDNVQISKNSFTRCSRGGIAVCAKVFTAADVFDIPPINPFGLVTTRVNITQNNFVRVQGPGIGFMVSPVDLFIGNYSPNLLTGPALGPNSYQPSPIIESATLRPDGSIEVKGKVTVAADGTIEVFASGRDELPDAPPLDGKAYGVGTFLQSIPIKRTDRGMFTMIIPASRAANVYALTATFTANLETSEFSRTLKVAGAPPRPDTEEPVVEVISPTQEQIIQSKRNATIDVEWFSTDNKTIASHTVKLAGKRNDVPFSQTVATGLPGETSTFSIEVVRDDVFSEGVVTVEAVDPSGNLGRGESGVFSVVLPPPPETEKPEVSILAPTEGTEYESKLGAEALIVWVSTDNVDVVEHRVTLNRDGRLETLASGLPGAAQSFIWNIPFNTSIAKATVTIQAEDEAGNVGEATSSEFTVVPPRVADSEKPVVSQITLSKKKVVRNKDASIEINWTSRDNVGVARHDISYSTDGQDFSTVVVSGLAGTVQKFTWTIPSTVAKTKTGSVLIEARDASGNVGFSFTPPTLVIK